MEFHGNRVEITDTPEKFAGMCEQVAPVLLNLLSALADAEKKAHEDFAAMEAVIETTNGTLDIYRLFTMKQNGDRWIWDDLQYSFDGKSWSNDSI